MAITYTVQPCERKEVRDFIEKWHYKSQHQWSLISVLLQVDGW